MLNFLNCFSVVIKTGCSASLVGLHEACRALQAGDCDAAIVAGTSLIMGPTTTAAMANEGIISPEGSCKTFDAAADGFARAEAINAVYVKRLDDAVRSRNPIRAVIRNTGTNCDGQSAGLMAPNGVAHELLMRKVYVDVGLDPNETAFMEVSGYLYSHTTVAEIHSPVPWYRYYHRRSDRDHGGRKRLRKKRCLYWLSKSGGATYFWLAC